MNTLAHIPPPKGFTQEPRLLVQRNSMDMEWDFCLWDGG